MALFHNNSFRKPKRSHFDEKKIHLCSYIFNSVFAGTVLSVCFKRFSPSIFSLIAVEIDLKNECQIYLSHQQLPSRATLSLLRFSTTAIELKLDGKCALIWISFSDRWLRFIFLEIPSSTQIARTFVSNVCNNNIMWSGITWLDWTHTHQGNWILTSAPLATSSWSMFDVHHCAMNRLHANIFLANFEKCLTSTCKCFVSKNKF